MHRAFDRATHHTRNIPITDKRMEDFRTEYFRKASVIKLLINNCFRLGRLKY
jgi:hypothetical protein